MAMSVASLEAFCDRVAADDDLPSQVHAAAGVDDRVAISVAPDHVLTGINSWGDALMHCRSEMGQCQLQRCPPAGLGIHHAASSSSAEPRGISLICLRPSLISNSSPGSRPSWAV